MNLKALYPPSKPRRYQWSTRRLLPFELKHLTRDFTRIAALRRRFYRFNTKPNWAGIAAANRGAHLVLQG